MKKGTTIVVKIGLVASVIAAIVGITCFLYRPAAEPSVTITYVGDETVVYYTIGPFLRVTIHGETDRELTVDAVILEPTAQMIGIHTSVAYISSSDLVDGVETIELRMPPLSAPVPYVPYGGTYELRIISKFNAFSYKKQLYFEGVNLSIEDFLFSLASWETISFRLSNDGDIAAHINSIRMLAEAEGENVWYSIGVTFTSLKVDPGGTEIVEIHPSYMSSWKEDLRGKTRMVKLEFGDSWRVLGEGSVITTFPSSM